MMMDPFVLVLRRGQRRRLLFGALGCVLAAVVCAVLSLLHVLTGARSQFTLPLLGVVAMVNAVVLADSAFGRTVVNEAGVTLWRPLRRRTVGWEDVDSFEDRESGDGDVSRVVLVTGSGGRRVLPAPMNASWGRDDELGARVQELRARLEMARGGLLHDGRR
jgi:Bacterial PH domain